MQKKTLAAGIPAPGAKIPKAKKEKQMLEYDSKLIKSKHSHLDLTKGAMSSEVFFWLLALANW